VTRFVWDLPGCIDTNRPREIGSWFRAIQDHALSSDGPSCDGISEEISIVSLASYS
jgi:hypothetical protein